MDEPELNTDELVAQMERDELADAALLTPRDFAKVIGVQPQLVYYYIRTKKLDVVVCQCGRKCVNVEAATKFFNERNQEVRKEPDVD
jgi:hypothetical protein